MQAYLAEAEYACETLCSYTGECMEKILACNLGEKERAALNKACINMRIRLMDISPYMYANKLGDLVRNAGIKGDYDSDCGLDNVSMVIFSDVKDKHFDRILAVLRPFSESITYKCAVTATNSEWNIYELCDELAKEKAYYGGKG